MTFHSPITAASPLALATAFGPLSLSRPDASAVVTIRKALDELPAEVRDGTLEEIAGLRVVRASFWETERFAGWTIDVSGGFFPPETELSVPGLLVADIVPLYRDAQCIGTSFLLVEGEDDGVANAAELLLKSLSRVDLATSVSGDQPTPDQLAVREKTCSVIATARRLLSPAMLALFLRWGEGASAFTTEHITDEAGDVKCDVHHQTLSEIGTLSTQHPHDLMFRVYLLALELADASCFGPLIGQPDEQFTVDRMCMDLVRGSELLAGLEDLSRLAWGASQSCSAWSLRIGSLVSAEFKIAQSRRSVGGVAEATAWNEALAKYLELRRIGDAATDENDPDLKMVDAYCVQQDVLFAVPAPDLAALVLKLEMFKERYDEWLCDMPVGDILADARRFAGVGAATTQALQ